LRSAWKVSNALDRREERREAPPVPSWTMLVKPAQFPFPKVL
jgi:hypothetical protein